MMIVFPVSGDLRLPLLIIEWIITLVILEQFIIFFIKYRNQEEKSAYKHDLGYSFLYLGLGITWLFLIVADYYSPVVEMSPFLHWTAGSWRVLFITIGYDFLALGFTFFVFFLERDRMYFRVKNVFTTIFISLFIITQVIFFVDLKISQFFVNIYWIFVLLFLMAYLRVLSQTSLKVRVKNTTEGFLKAFIPFLILVLSLLFTRDMFSAIVGLIGRFIASCIHLSSVIWLFAFFIKIPPVPEMDWKARVNSVYLFSKSGVCIFKKDYNKVSESHSIHIITSAMSTINSLLQELTESGETGISVIKKEGAIITSFIGEELDGVVFSSNDLSSIKTTLTELVEKIESIYLNVLKNWNGDPKIFLPVVKISDSLFGKK